MKLVLLVHLEFSLEVKPCRSMWSKLNFFNFSYVNEFVRRDNSIDMNDVWMRNYASLSKQKRI